MLQFMFHYTYFYRKRGNHKFHDQLLMNLISKNQTNEIFQNKVQSLTTTTCQFN